MIDVIAMKSSAEFRARNRRHFAVPQGANSDVAIDGRALRVAAIVGCGLFWAAVLSALIV